MQSLEYLHNFGVAKMVTAAELEAIAKRGRSPKESHDSSSVLSSQMRDTLRHRGFTLVECLVLFLVGAVLSLLFTAARGCTKKMIRHDCTVESIEAFIVLANLEPIPLADLRIDICALDEELRGEINRLHEEAGEFKYGPNEPPILQAKEHLSQLKHQLDVLRNNKNPDQINKETPRELELKNFISATTKYISRKLSERRASQSNDLYKQVLRSHSRSHLRTHVDGRVDSFLLTGPGPWIVWATTTRLNPGGDSEDFLWIEAIPADESSTSITMTNRTIVDLAFKQVELPPPLAE
jgi:type II secretory pathway pseudopilin PulG